MHPEAYAGFGRMLAKSGLDPATPLRILDVGGQDVNGSVHDYFTHPDTVITTLDLQNADIIADARLWQPDRLFDVVIATEVFEHVAEWPLIVLTMHSALDPEGPGVLLVTCASTHRQPHGATGAAAPSRGEHYRNVDPDKLRDALRNHFLHVEVEYQNPPGDAYAWARTADQVSHQISVIIPTIPSRAKMLRRALDSVEAQSLPATAVIVEHDTDREGPAAVRNRAASRVETDWIAFLDDDDYLLPDHLATLARAQADTGADLVWPWFRVEGGGDPFPMFYGRQWDPADPHQIPITFLLRTEAFRAVGGFETVEEGPAHADGNRAGEDWRLTLALSEAGYKFHHVKQRSWVWVHHRANSSGLPSRVRW